MASKNRTCLVWIGFAATFLLPGFYSVYILFHEPIQPRNLTVARMFILKRRILQYAATHNALPPSLSVLPPMPSNFDSELTDAWGRPVEYSPDPATGLVTLRSPGPESSGSPAPGNSPISAVFRARDPHGGWADPTSPWLKDPLN